MTNEDILKHHSTEMIQQLISAIAKKNKADIRFEFEDNEQWSVITWHIEDEDKEISIRLNAYDTYHLHLGYYNVHDEFVEIIQKLTIEEKKMIPKALAKIMQKVLEDEQDMRVPGTLLTK